MGCDIHMFFEVETDDSRHDDGSGWQAVAGVSHLVHEHPSLAKLLDLDEDTLVYKAWMYYQRNYRLFATLSNVRNYDGIIPIIPDGIERGIPHDVSEIVLNEYREGEPDFHSPTWYTLDELEHARWDEKVRGLPITLGDHPHKINQTYREYANHDFPDRTLPMLREVAGNRAARIILWYDN